MTFLNSDTIDEQTPKKTIYIEDAIKAAECIVEHHAITPYKTMAAAMDHLKRILNGMSPAQPEQRWIPCDETVEIPDHEVLACDKYGEEILGYLKYADDQWICASEDCVMYDTIAWMEKPKPPHAERKDNGH